MDSESLVLMQPWLRPPQRGDLQCGDKVAFRKGPRSGHGRIIRIDKDNRVHVETAHGIEVFSDADAQSLGKAAAVVAVVGPGAGVGSIGSVYLELDNHPELQVEMVGRKGMPYDCYPDSWQSGRPAPNLQSFGEDVVRIGVHNRVDCFLFGSRGGQVVLPILWHALRNATPPSVVVNGGCAMRLPGPPICWPERAVTVMLLGGQDFFRAGISRDEYLQRTFENVPDSNATTAFFFAARLHSGKGRQDEVARAALRHLIFAALAWSPEAPQRIPLSHFDNAAEALLKEGFAGFMCFKNGRNWSKKYFGQMPLDRQPPPLSPRIPRPPGEPCPPYSTVSVFPAKVAVGDSKEGHERLANEAQRLAGACRASSGSLRSALLEFAQGQDAEAWAAEDDRIMKQLKDKQKQAASDVPSGPPRAVYLPQRHLDAPVAPVAPIAPIAPVARGPWIQADAHQRPPLVGRQPFPLQAAHPPHVQPRPLAYSVHGASPLPLRAQVPEMHRSFPPSFPQYR
eukprot:s4352_g3.t2